MGAFEWTTPTRRARSRALSPIPIEVYVEIYSYFEPSEETSLADCKRVLSNLALVCRFFCAHSISRIYRSLEFSGHDASRGHGPFCALLLKSTLSGGRPLDADVQFAVDVGQFVREVVFKDWLPSDRSIRFADAFFERDVRAVRLLPNIARIHLESTPLSKALIRTIADLKPTLTTLSLRSCTLESDLTGKQRQKLDALRLTSLEVLGTSSISRELPPSTLRLRELDTFRTDSWTLGLFFLKRQHPSLRVLELCDVQDLPALFVFLEKCPTLRELIITKIVRQVDPIPVPVLSPTALPHIEAITIPPSWLPYFAKRPLRKVSLLGAEARDWQGRDVSVDFFPTLRPLTPTALAALTQSTAQITELHIPQHVYFAVPLHEHLARLEVLGLAYRHPNFPQGPAHGRFSEDVGDRFRMVVPFTDVRQDLDGAITAICAEWPSSTPVHELRLDFGFVLASANTSVCDLQHQARLVERLSLTFPDLRRVSFARFFVWVRAGDRAPSAWRVFVPHVHRQAVRDALARGQHFTDFGACFGGTEW
ncbi:hypothetical protein GGX14DRAFT_593281 [Mycena pura]|uniref:F-box domain-containing protein n=1 Tax=Mycena pura TaxID=153505 RepID=A0AAD6XYV7_9AGAR|nr:hypothetical protein GGX14DRAFT_593281 [Mycena pura]